jgi:hypothetical protein
LASHRFARACLRLALETKDKHSGLLKFPEGLQSVFYEFLDESKRQVDAAGDRAVRWYFSEKETVQFAAKVFHCSDEGREKLKS